jgi:hypothetical protein
MMGMMNECDALARERGTYAGKTDVIGHYGERRSFFFFTKIKSIYFTVSKQIFTGRYTFFLKK